MSGVSLTIAASGGDQVMSYLTHLGAWDRRGFLESMGAEVESQTRRRLNQPRGSEVGPDGMPWPAWSDEYEETRHSNHKMLQDSGRLLDSITYRLAGSDGVQIGTNLLYASAHQHGGTIQVPERKGTVRLRTDRHGQLLSQAKDDRGRNLPHKRTKAADGDLFQNLAVFAGKRHKNAVERSFVMAAHEFTMPGRPFLGISAEDRRDLMNLQHDFFRNLLP